MSTLLEKIIILRWYFEKVSIFSVLGVVLAAGLGIALFWNDKDDAGDAGKKQGSFQQDANEVIKRAVEVAVSDDGSVNANHLNIPWTINKNGSWIFLSQREGSVIQIDGNLGLVDVQNVKVSEDIFHEGEGGFLGFTLASDFATTKMAFAYHTYKKDGKTLNRIISLKLKDHTWKEEKSF